MDRGVRETLGQRLARFEGVGPGFDFVRLLLASGVVVWHIFALTTDGAAIIGATPFWFVISAMVPMFFALSGYLVSASAERSRNVREYLLSRTFRIFPALAVVVLFTTFVLGPLLTTLPLSSYFQATETWRYLGNSVGMVAFTLPGVFADNPNAGNVNGSLWTVPHEIACYLMMAVLIYFRLARHWQALLAIFLSIVAHAFFTWAVPESLFEGTIFTALYSIHFVQGAKIIPFFLLGSILYLLRDRIPYDHRLAALAFLVVLGIGMIGPAEWRKSPLLWLLSAPCFVYLVVWAGLTRLPKPHIFGGGDFSYGIYLWHFPILQTLILTLHLRNWWSVALVGALPILAVAALSWRHVEKLILSWWRHQRRKTALVAASSR